MSITASTSGYDAIVRGGPGKSVFEDPSNVTASVSWNQGDLIAFDTSAHKLKVVTAQTDAANFVGIAENSIVSGKLAGPYDGLTANNTASIGPKFCGPKYGVVANMKLLSGDAFTTGCPVYLPATGGDSQTVSVTAPTTADPIGIYQGAAVTAGAGSTGAVLIGSRYPNVAVSSTIAAALSF